MIFNNELNKLIKLLMEIDTDFQYDFINFVNHLPEEIKYKIRNNMKFYEEENRAIYQLDYYGDNDECIELSVQVENEEFLLDIQTNKISLKSILSLQQQEIDEEKESNLLDEILGFTYTDEQYVKTDYSFELCRTSTNKYLIISTKNIFDYCTGEITVDEKRKISKEITYSQLINKLKTNNTRR